MTRKKRRTMQQRKRMAVWALCIIGCGRLFAPPFAVRIAAQQPNQPLPNHRAARRLNREGYLAYRQKNWGLALEKFARAAELDPYYTYPLYNQACVLSLRARSKNTFPDVHRIYRLLLEVLLQAEYREKIRTDPDLAWFRRHAPELLAALNAVQPDSEAVYRKLRERPVWNVETLPYSPDSNLFMPFLKVPENADNQENTGGVEMTEGMGQAEVSAPPSALEAALSRPLPVELEGVLPDPENTEDFMDFHTSPLREPALLPLEVQKDLAKGSSEDSDFAASAALWPSGPDAQPAIMFRGHRYAWRFRADEKWFELRGFFTVQGNVVILETFAADPKELENLPFDWDSFRSILLLYHEGQFVALSAAGEQIKIY